MQSIKFKPFRAGRKALVLGGVVAVAGLSLLGGNVAHAALGTQPGTLTLTGVTAGTPAPLTGAPTWNTTVACPAGNQGSAKLVEVKPSGALLAWSGNINGAAAPLSNEPLLTGATVGQLTGLAGWAVGQTAELVVDCFSAASGGGTVVPFNDAFITLNADGTTYTITNTPPAGPDSTSVTVFASPNPVQVGNTVTLTATVTDTSASATTPVGSVQFGIGGATPSNIGAPVAVGANGKATTTTTFTAQGATPIVASFTPTDPTKFNPSTTATPFTENVSATNPNQVQEIVTVTVPFQGAFSFGTSDGVAQPTVPLTVNTSTSPLTATGTIDAVKVVDTRTGTASFNGFPGWSVVGQAQDFSNPNSTPVGTIPATDLAWTPAAANGDYVPGSAAPSLATAQVLGSAAEGHGQGTSILGAGLSLTIPASAPAGAYTSTLTLTANPNANTP